MRRLGADCSVVAVKRVMPEGSRPSPFGSGQPATGGTRSSSVALLTQGRGLSGREPVAMRLVPLDRTMQLPLTVAGGLRTIFADLVSAPIPERLAALTRRLPIAPNAQGRSP